jgi:hypothetical protein
MSKKYAVQTGNKAFYVLIQETHAFRETEWSIIVEGKERVVLGTEPYDHKIHQMTIRDFFGRRIVFADRKDAEPRQQTKTDFVREIYEQIRE